MIDNRDFGQWVFPRGYEKTPFPVPVVLNTEKTPGTFRVFVLGESAAMGFPEPSVSFARVLEVLLRTPYSPSRRFIQGNLAVRRTRTGQLLASLVQGAKGDGAAPKTWGGMAMFVDSQVAADDPRLRRIYDHFRDNLTDICRVGAGAGVPVAVCTVPVNLRESAPFASAHRPGLSPEQTAAWDALFAEGARLEAEGQHAAAADRYSEAEKIDDRFADLAYRLGRCRAALGRPVEARAQFGRARDLDALRFRSDAAVNETIREVAAAQAGRAAAVHRPPPEPRGQRVLPQPVRCSAARRGGRSRGWSSGTWTWPPACRR